MKAFNLSDIELTKYLFFTGKGGVGKTSIACATAVGLADKGKKILLISTDPASNLQDVFDQSLNGHGTAISEVPGLTVVNLHVIFPPSLPVCGVSLLPACICRFRNRRSQALWHAGTGIPPGASCA